MCLTFKMGGWYGVRDPYYQAPYASQGSQWIGYDDSTSIRLKVLLPVYIMRFKNVYLNDQFF